MGAPTWPPTPEAADRATLAEYGDGARAVLTPHSLRALDDDEAERALLAPFLLAAPGALLAHGTPLHSLRPGLAAWLAMVDPTLAGRRPAIGVADPASTDGRDLFLPRTAPGPAPAAHDRLVFRTAALVQLGLLRFGLLDNEAHQEELVHDWVLRSCFHLLAARWVVRRWTHLWPGLAADFEAIRLVPGATQLRIHLTEVPRLGMPAVMEPLIAPFVAPGPAARGPGVELTLAAGRAVDAAGARAGIHDPAAVRDPAAMLVLVGQARRVREALRRLRVGAPPTPWWLGALRPEWVLHDVEAELRAGEAWREGPRPLAPLRRALLKRALGARALGKRAPGRPDSVPLGVHPEAGPGAPLPRPEAEKGERYDEWDAQQEAYRSDAVLVHEEDAPVGNLEAWTRLESANAGGIRDTRRAFAALHAEERWLHGQRDGSELDLHRAVDALADLRAGHSPRGDWFLRYRRQPRAVAVLVLVDQSGSTRGDAIRAEREALVLLGVALREVGVAHAILGFRSAGPERCTVLRHKGWDEPWSDTVRRRLAHLDSDGATRLGAFLRHGCRQLGRRPEPRRLLLLLSDGRPHCTAPYTGDQALADAALAAREAEARGVVLWCASLDRRPEAPPELERVFGRGHFAVVHTPDALPARLAAATHQLFR